VTADPSASGSERAPHPPDRGRADDLSAAPSSTALALRDRAEVPALLSQFDGLIDLADEIEARQRTRSPRTAYDPIAAEMRARRQGAVAPHDQGSRTSPGSAAVEGDLGDTGLPWVRYLVGALVVLLVAVLMALAAFRLQSFLEGDDSTAEGASTGESAGEPASADQAGPAGSGSVGSCPASVLLEAAEAVIGEPALGITGTACEGSYAVARVGPLDPAQPAVGEAWVALRLEAGEWQPIAVGWIVEPTAWTADCATVQTDVDPVFPVGLCR
jgi:hypothetical protein